MAGQRISPTIAMSTVANSVQQQQQHQRPSLATTVRHKRSSISSMDSAAVVSDACDEPLYSRIDHSSSNESQREATTTTAAAGSSITAPSNHDGMTISIRAGCSSSSRSSSRICFVLHFYVWQCWPTHNVNLVTLGHFKCPIIAIDGPMSRVALHCYTRIRASCIFKLLKRVIHI